MEEALNLSSERILNEMNSTNTACTLGHGAKGSGFEFHKVSTDRETRAKF